MGKTPKRAKPPADSVERGVQIEQRTLDKVDAGPELRKGAARLGRNVARGLGAKARPRKAR